MFLPPLLKLPMPGAFRGFFLGFFCLILIVAPVASGIFGVIRMKNQFQRITVTHASLRVEELKRGKRTDIEIPINELEDLVAPMRPPVFGMEPNPIGNTGTLRMPDGRPAPRFLVALNRMSDRKGIIARSDKVSVEFAAGFDEAEMAYLFALIKETILR
jgi:hypothetical protein